MAKDKMGDAKAAAKKAWSTRRDRNDQNFPHYFWYFVACAIATFALLRLARLCLVMVRSTRPVRTSRDVEDGPKSARRQASLVERAFRATCAAMNKYTSIVTVPILGYSVGELVVVSSYILTVFVFSFYDTPNSPMGIKAGVGWSNRMGMMSFASLPFVIALAGKNNVVSFLTGVSYERLQFLHKVSARMMLLLSLLHMVGRTIQMKPDVYHRRYVHYGLAALSAGFVIFVVSNRFVMSRRYELFFAIHILMSLVYVVGSWKHYPAEKNYVWPALLLWGLDRFVRLLRVLIFNGLWRFGKYGAEGGSKEFNISIVGQDTLRLEVVKPDFPEWTPGSHAFISIPGSHWLPQGHPFTIASIPPSSYSMPTSQEGRSSPTSDDEGKQARDSMTTNSASTPGCEKGSSSDVLGGSSEDLKESREKSDMVASASSREDWQPPAKKLVFLIKVREGWTKSLRDLVDRSETKAIRNLDRRLRGVLVDGPYSAPDPLDKRYDKIVFISGGSGISWTLPQFLHLLVKSERQGRASVRASKIVLIWIVREFDYIEGIRPELIEAHERMRSCPRMKETFEIKIYVTRSPSLGDKERNLDASVQITNGRPKISEMLEEQLVGERGRKFIGASGPNPLLNEIKSESRKLIRPLSILSGKASEDDGDLIVKTEVFGW
ncbi:hypothetical protein IE53DRAFT_377289 [Violaceomyces palustris]|uniref:Uncharacterized protein n=1 Tax=Violaceomyces palustris TaxID=1673888 RepID=A0ACD0P5V6_9BASI|nr:hypothetical protein IE53DRAFT_377289 [Violaceomyces palustris]